MSRELTIKETQSVSLEILKTVADICEEQKLRYTLIYGTLIGAIRHKGYIPWDDDVDIMMPRPDYDKLLVYLREHIEDYPNLRVFNHDECKEYPYMITRISDQRYVIKMENEKPFGMGVFIDIYPYDGLGITKDEALAYGMKGDRLSSLCYQATRDHFAIETTTSRLRKIIKYPVYLFAKMCGKNYFQNKLQSLAGLKDYNTSEYIGCVVWLSGGEKDIFLRKWFDETIMVPFEKYEFRVPKYYDEVLRHGYGDYMKLPPEENRIGHHFFKVYEK
ncbi:LicD family protein [Turicibacter bilis]|uniref:LicD family protein n=1 Tax=Turicibacter bilis TaxID=2735723 RepID=UPI001BAFB4A9|nr:LicD family protein [Turicibacter bilis]MBS3202807.1 LicD family protein [Turicibacter bilis]UUF11140.1 LicD family protein [Turicibacter bilis]